MKPTEALSILDQAAALAPLNRQSHIQVQEAVQVLRAEVDKKAKRVKKD